jgi:hypothetical protein
MTINKTNKYKKNVGIKNEKTFDCSVNVNRGWSSLGTASASTLSSSLLSNSTTPPLPLSQSLWLGSTNRNRRNWI